MKINKKLLLNKEKIFNYEHFPLKYQIILKK